MTTKLNHSYDNSHLDGSTIAIFETINSSKTSPQVFKRHFIDIFDIKREFRLHATLVLLCLHFTI